MANKPEQIFLLNADTTQSTDILDKSPSDALDNLEDFSNVCRICATVTECIVPIFEGEGLQHELADKIATHLPIKVSEQDRLPHGLCYGCMNTLLAWHELTVCCSKTDSVLRSHPLVTQVNGVVLNPGSNDLSPKELVCNAPSPREKPSNKSLSPVSGSHVTHCRHCVAAVDTEHYNAHVVQQHSDLVFLCDECRDYVNRKEFFRHMALHAIDYHLSRGRGRKQKEPPGGNPQEEHKSDTVKEQQICLKTSDCIVKDNQTDPEKVPVTKTESPAKEVGSEVKSNASRECAEASNVTDKNEFSDRSDSEFGFEPIPSSVFRAIEDSQDTQPTRDDATVSEPDKTNTANELPNVVTETENELKSAVTTNAAKNESKSVKKSRTCEICGKVCNAPSTYFYHMKHTHRRSRDHPCADCGKRFGTRAALTAHGSVHDARALHECSTCGKAFRTRAGLYIHEQAHSGNKPHSCATCGAGFRWRTQLSRHAARHLARRAHACGTCGRAFSVRADLLRHARTHAAAALPCPHCGLRLAQPRYLKVHIRKRHPDVADKV